MSMIGPTKSAQIMWRLMYTMKRKKRRSMKANLNQRKSKDIKKFRPSIKL